MTAVSEDGPRQISKNVRGQTMKREKISWLAGSIFLAGALGSVLPTASRRGTTQAQDNPVLGARSFSCNNGAVSGKYAYHLTGSLAGVGATAAIGTFSQSHDGSFTGRHSASSFNGQIVHDIPYSGTLSVAPDCVATGTFTDATGLKVTFKYVAMERGRELHFLNTDPGNVFSGVAKRIE